MLVVVAYRVIIGKPNKPGGVGRIKTRSLNGEECKMYSVVYVLGGKEENIEEVHISLAAQQIAPRERKKAEVYEPKITEGPKRRKVTKKSEEKPQKKKRVEKKLQTDVSARSSSAPDLDVSYVDQLDDSETEDDVGVEEEKISDEVYELAVVIYHEARRRDADGEAEIDLEDIKNKFQLVAGGKTETGDVVVVGDGDGAADIAASASGPGGEDEEDERMVVTEELFQEALDYLTEQNKIMVCDMLLYFI